MLQECQGAAKLKTRKSYMGVRKSTNIHGFNAVFNS